MQLVTLLICSLPQVLTGDSVDGGLGSKLSSWLMTEAPEGEWTASLRTEKQVVPQGVAAQSSAYVTEIGCVSWSIAPGMEQDPLRHLRNTPKESSLYTERASWNITDKGFECETVIDSFSPPLVTHVQWDGVECRRWDVSDGVSTDMHRYSLGDPFDAISGSLFLYLREAKRLNDIVTLVGDRGIEEVEDYRWSMVFQLDKDVRSLLISPDDSRYLMPINGIQELPGEVSIELTEEPGRRKLLISWLDCGGGVLTQTLISWEGSGPLPDTFVEEHFVAGTEFIHTRREGSYTRVLGTTEEVVMKSPYEGQRVIDRRFGTPVAYRAKEGGAVPTSRELVQRVELSANRLSALGVENLKTVQTGVMPVGNGKTQPVEQDSSGTLDAEDEKERLGWPLAIVISGIGLAVILLGIRRRN